MKSTITSLTAIAIVLATGFIDTGDLILHVRGDQPQINTAKSEKRAFLVREMAWLAFLDADGRLVEEFQNLDQGAISPGGKWLAAVRKAEHDLTVRPLGGSEEPIKLELALDFPCPYAKCYWSFDSKRLLIWETGSSDQKNFEYASRIYDMASGKMSTLKLPKECRINDWAADGRRLLVDTMPESASLDGSWYRGIAWLSADGNGAPEFVTGRDEIATAGRLSPDGKQLLFLTEQPKNDKYEHKLCVMDLASKKRTILREGGIFTGHCWSPDGKQVAFAWQKWLAKPEEVMDRETELIVCDSNGLNPRTVIARSFKIARKEDRTGYLTLLELIDWR